MNDSSEQLVELSLIIPMELIENLKYIWSLCTIFSLSSVHRGKGLCDESINWPMLKLIGRWMINIPDLIIYINGRGPIKRRIIVNYGSYV